MISSKIKGICFDYYGTLVDIGKPFDKIKHWFESYHSDHNQDLNINHFNWLFAKRRSALLYGKDFKIGMQILTESYIFACDKLQVRPNIDEFMNIVTNIFSEAKPFQNAVQTISFLKQRYLVGLITNADNNLLYDSIRNNRFDFDFIVSSEDVQCNKPNYEIFIRAMQIVNLSAYELLMVGDSLVEDILPAKKLGIEAIWLKKDKEEQETIMSIKNIHDLVNCVFCEKNNSSLETIR